MDHSEILILDRLSNLLAHRAYDMGCNAFSFGEKIFPLEAAMDAAGPVPWALVLHADAICFAAGLAHPNEWGALPFYNCVTPDAPFGNELRLQPGRLPHSLATSLMDAALEHAICTGMNSFGMSPAEWDQLDLSERTIPLEPYLADLQNNWITKEMESGDIRQQVYHWPLLLSRENFDSMTPELRSGESSINRSQLLGFPRMS
jgi:hypothetical protein